MSKKKLFLIASALLLSLVAGAGLKIARRRATLATSSASPESSGPRVAVALDVAETVYDGKRFAGWDDWGWGPHELSAGPARVVFGGFGGIIFHHSVLEPKFSAVSFRYKAPEDWPEFLNVSLKSQATTGDHWPNVAVQERHVAPLPNGWREVLIDLSELDPDGLSFDRIVIGARAAVPFDWVTLDKVVLVKRPGQASDGQSRDVQLAVQCRAPTRSINPMIYGSAQGSWDSGQSAQRWGGNPTSRFNWDLGVWNSANDWFYENGNSVRLSEFLEAGVQHGAQNVVTVPTLGWVAKDAVSVGFPRSRFPDQRKFDANRAEAGDGHRADGSPLPPGPPTQTSVAAPPELIGRWVREQRERDQAHGTRSVKMYILDNEPSLWDTTHHDVHPEPVGYDELLDRTLRYATEVRKADPDALIAGPAEWGWLGYMDSGKDRVGKNQKDRAAHGGLPLVPWYLRQIAAHEKASGSHLLDVLDVHFYPAAEGIYGDNARTDPDGAALRLRSTRALWDPKYVDESWIKEPIKLIPRLKEWVAIHHPGLAISLGEWSFGADRDISGGLATAEALGRFGQQGLDAAFYWDGPKPGTATFAAFRAFRNFDGKGARFQDLSLTTKEGDQVSLFASRDAESTHLVAILLNLNQKQSATASLDLDGCAQATAYRVFRLDSKSNDLSLQNTRKQDGQRISEELPPYSLTVLDITTARVR